MTITDPSIDPSTKTYENAPQNLWASYHLSVRTIPGARGEWRPFSPINNHLVICPGWYVPNICLEGGIYVVAKRLRAHEMTPFFFKLKSSLKDPFFFFIVLTKWPPIFLLSSLTDPIFSLFSLSPKDPYFWGRVRTSPSLPYVIAPPRHRCGVIHVHTNLE